MALDEYALTSLANVKSYLGISGSDDDALLTEIINRASGYIEQICDRKFAQRDFREWYDGDGSDRLQLDAWPVFKVYRVGFGVGDALTVSGNVTGDISASIDVSMDNVSLNRIESNGNVTNSNLAYSSYNTTTELATQISSITGFTASVVKNVSTRWLHPVGGIDVVDTSFTMTYCSDSESEYRVNYDTGSVYLRSSPHWYSGADAIEAQKYPSTRRSVLVEYQAGFSPIPYAVEQAAIEVAASIFSRKDVDENLSSESLGDYSYSLRPPQDVMDSAQRLIWTYRKLR